MSSPAEQPHLLNGHSVMAPEPESQRKESASSGADPNFADEAKAEPVSSAGENRDDLNSEPAPEEFKGSDLETGACEQEVDPKLRKGESTPMRPDAAAAATILVRSPSVEAPHVSEFSKDGERTVTMMELLNGMKSDQSEGYFDASAPDLDSADSHASTPRKQIPSLDSFTVKLINSISAADEQDGPHQRVLALAASRFASAVQRNPGDHDAHYNWALILQESVDNIHPTSISLSKDTLLEEACQRYEEATRLCPTFRDAYYNWAIAISDRARIRGRTKEGEEMWKQATRLYEKAVELNWNSPQALNNWGLALQQLSDTVPAKEKLNIILKAIRKFRAAIRLQSDFHRAIYNLGTILYGLAEDTLNWVRVSSTEKQAINKALQSQCAVYIASAHALKPKNSVYQSALKLVRSMLPLPYLKKGYLSAPPMEDPTSPHSEWKQAEFLLNHEALYQLPVRDDDKRPRRSFSNKLNDGANGKRLLTKVEVPDIESVSASADLSLPPGPGLCILTTHGPVYMKVDILHSSGLLSASLEPRVSSATTSLSPVQGHGLSPSIFLRPCSLSIMTGIYRVADSWESLDEWLDALRLVYTIFAKGKADVLAGIITR